MQPVRVRADQRLRSGLSLREAMAVILGIVCLLVALHPNYVRHVQQERRSEAMEGLAAIERSQADFLSEHGRYSDSLSELGLALEGGHLRGDGSYMGRIYLFTLSSWDEDGSSHYRASAVADLDASDPTLDIVSVGSDVAARADGGRVFVLSDDVDDVTRPSPRASGMGGLR